MEEGIEWVQANCPVTNIRAQQYCQKHGLEKLNQLFNRIAYQKMIAAIQKWRETIEFEKNQEKVDNYMKWKGSRRLIKMVQEWDLKQLMSAYDKWHHTIMQLKKKELDHNAVQIQKVARGFLGRRRVSRMRRNKSAIQIQRVGRGMLGRKLAREKRWEKKRHDAATLIHLRWRGYECRKLGKIIKQKHREYEAACLLQRAWRGYKGRAIAKVIAMKKLENDIALRIQNLWRTRAARRLVASMRAAIAEEEAALYIQTWWRGILGARGKPCSNHGATSCHLREESAMKIQGAWRIYLARKKVEHRRLEMAALRVQCAWRARSGRMAYHLKKQAKIQIERKKQKLLQSCNRFIAGEQHGSGLKNTRNKRMQQKNTRALPQKAAKKDLARRYAAQQKSKQSERLALENRMALRIQCAWRGRKGRLATHLKMQARKAREREEREAALKIQTQFRGKQGRMAFKQKQMDVAEKKAQERIKREKQEQEEMEGAATLIQGKWRGKMSKDELERRRQAKRARELLEEKDLHEREMALKIQAIPCCGCKEESRGKEARCSYASHKGCSRRREACSRARKDAN